VYQNLANLYAQKNEIDRAIEYYHLVLKYSPHNPGNSSKVIDERLWHKKMNAKEAYIDAHTNIAVMYIKQNDIKLGLFYSNKAAELNPDNFVAHVNVGDLLRQVGKRDEAIKYTWELIQSYTNKTTDSTYIHPEPIDCSKIKPEDTISDNTNVICVKWGTKYGPDYVNKLYNGIKRNTTKPFTFLCFTDNADGLEQGIKAVPLKENWKGWWGKATLFSKDCGLEGRNFFIDLDMIITGNIDDVMSFDEPFGILRSDLFACEKENKDGYNSSIIIWNSKAFEPIYSELKRNVDNIHKYIVRFDFWLEMMVKNPSYLQDKYKGIVDFTNECMTELPKHASVVCFPRSPKPHECDLPWIKQHWV